MRTDAIQSFVTQETPIVRITCADGAMGTGYTYTIGTGGSSVVALLRDHLAPRLIGRDAAQVEAIWKDLFFATHATAVGAITSLALAAIDTALWDLRCRRAGEPLWKLAGGAQARVPVYTTEGGWLHHSAEAAGRRSSDGEGARIPGRKVKVGKPSIAEDVARLSAVRAAVGDASRSWSTPTRRSPWPRRAAARTRTSDSCSPGSRSRCRRRIWAATSSSRRKATMPIAIGESLYHPAHFREYLAARRLLDRAGRLRAHRRHHAVAQGRASRRDVQRRRSAPIS